MHSLEPSFEGQCVEEKKGISFNKLPKWILEIILQKLTVIDRLRLERVDWFWNGMVWGNSWKGQTKLNYKVVFEGADGVHTERFTNKSLISLLKRVLKGLFELDLRSFFMKLPITVDICASFHLLPNIHKIDIVGFNLLAVVPFLPTTLCEIRSSGPFNKNSLPALTAKCPNLEEISFSIMISGEPARMSGVVSNSCVNEFLLKYPCLRKLRLACKFMPSSGTLTSIGELRDLEEFVWDRSDIAFNEVAFEAMIEGCKKLRRLEIRTQNTFLEQSFCKLSKLPNLVELGLHHPNITDTTVKAISKCRNLKKVDISFCELITDASVIELVENCKSLVSLSVIGCHKITEKSLEAVVTEVKRRPSLPMGTFDDGLFYFYCEDTEIIRKKAFYLNRAKLELELEFTEA